MFFFSIRFIILNANSNTVKDAFHDPFSEDLGGERTLRPSLDQTGDLLTFPGDLPT